MFSSPKPGLKRLQSIYFPDSIALFSEVKAKIVFENIRFFKYISRIEF